MLQLRRKLTLIRGADEKGRAELWVESTGKELPYSFKSVNVEIFVGSVEQERVTERRALEFSVSKNMLVL